MTNHDASRPGERRRIRARLPVCAIALCLGIPMAAADPQEEADGDSRAIRPVTIPATRPSSVSADVPAVQLASPRLLNIAIGSGYSVVRLSGAHLDKVIAASVVESDGDAADGFDVRIGSRNRTDDRLQLSIIAGRPVAPGDYSLKLSYELDDPRPLTSPQGAPRKSVLRSTVVPGSKVTIRARAMEPVIQGVTPDPLVLGKEYGGIRVAIADLPGTDVLSVTRFKPSGYETYCEFEGSYYSPDETYTTRWEGEHRLEILISPGTLSPFNRVDSCRLRFSVRTRNALGEEFYSLVETPIEFAPPPPDTRRAYRVSDTRQLQRYLGFKAVPYAGLGICSGTSAGTSGLIPVGVIDVGGDIALRIRSGPVGTKCEWIVHARGLRDSWELRLEFRKEQVGNKCDDSIGSSAGGAYRFGREAPLYFDEGTLILSEDNPNGDIPPYDLQTARKYIRYINLSCTPTVTNDHGVTLRMISAELYGNGAPNCTWKCGVRD